MSIPTGGSRPGEGGERERLRRGCEDAGAAHLQTVLLWVRDHLSVCDEPIRREQEFDRFDTLRNIAGEQEGTQHREDLESRPPAGAESKDEKGSVTGAAPV